MAHSSARFLSSPAINLSLRCDCLLAGVWVQSGQTDRVRLSVRLPAHLNRNIHNLVVDGDIGTEAGSRTVIHQPDGIGAQRLLLVGLGEQGDGAGFSPRVYDNACQAAATEMARLSLKKAVSTLHLVKVRGGAVDWRIQQFIRQVLYARYQFSDYQNREKERHNALSVSLPLGDARQTPEAKASFKQAVARAQAIALGESACRDLGNTPPNVCTPEFMARKARGLAKKYKSLKVDILDEKQMERERMGALLAVARGSRNKPRLIILHYRHRSAPEKPVVLVGKGISFDTGGISLKPAQAMDEMKFDMCGAASVFGAVQAIAELGLRQHVIGVMVCAENMPDGNASRPGDIVRTRAGLNVEILNTDAEGRLVLCDALDYIKRYRPASVIDIATLTGACVIALGKVASGMMSNDEQLAQALNHAAQKSMDAVWRLPLWEEYSEQLKSPVADVANIGGRDAGTITAACFLWKFCKDYRWAHLDIAGTAWLAPPQRAATGRPVPLLCQYLIDLADPA